MKAAISIRAAKISERQALEELQRVASLESETYRAQILAQPDAIDLPIGQIERGEVFVAEILGRVAGFAAIIPLTDGDIELDGLFVEPAQWRRGVGRALVNYACGYAKSLKARALVVTANPDALNFYKSCGFEAAGEAMTLFGPAPRMAKAAS